MNDTLRISLAAILGGALPVAFAPLEFWWLAPALVAAWLLLITATVRRVFWVGFAFGAGAFLTGTYWLYHSISVIGKAPLPLTLVLILGMVAIMALYFGATAKLTVLWSRSRPGVSLVLFPAVFVVLEWLRGWVLSGFPWLNLGYTLTDTPLAGWLPVGGVYLGSLAVVILAAALVAVVRGPRLIGTGVGVAVLVVGLALTPVRWTDTEEASVTVAIGQLGIDQELKWDPDQFEKTLRWYAEFIARNGSADVIVLPEVAIPTLAQRVPDYLDNIEQFARQRDADVLLGILRRDDEAHVYNSVLALGRSERQWYAKRHLVPYGDFFPVPQFVRDWLEGRGLPSNDLTAGVANPVPIRLAGVPVATSICYEDAYASEQLAFFPDARFIVNVSNDAWFGDSIAPHQHLQIARTRSAESERWQVRATNTGVTGIIDDRGRLVASAPSFEPAEQRGSVKLRAGHTPYTRLGNGLALALCGLVLLSCAVVRRNEH